MRPLSLSINTSITIISARSRAQEHVKRRLDARIDTALRVYQERRGGSDPTERVNVHAATRYVALVIAARKQG